MLVSWPGTMPANYKEDRLEAQELRASELRVVAVPWGFGQATEG